MVDVLDRDRALLDAGTTGHAVPDDLVGDGVRHERRECAAVECGLAFGELRATTFGLSESHTNAGWTLGAGAEMGFAPNWSAKIEYLYVDLANSNFVVTGASNGYRFGLIRAGVNYRF